MDEIKKQLGVNLRILRKKRAWTLDQVAHHTGVSKAMLGQIERGESNPSVGTIWKIANGLKVSFSSLLAVPSSQVSVIRAESIEVLEEDDGKYRVLPIFTYDPVRQWEYFMIELDPGCEYVSESHGATVEEYITVTRGELHITIQQEEYKLSPNDSIRFKADSVHKYENRGTHKITCQMVIHYLET
ncbi:XRE family transcriptional regulator [Jeotgalibacillus sp. S-D1]|uniref:helix-turn-helix domain-containing protein n=1 Tax=Jeotgalibacillus sp. S-D1 TaxID=2552189 RepID=UPI0010594629|nr:XRE family transcriptional regulator [Jeotgalibacillus sp. S-D1]TDL35373.1 XRE family transcriptional regulator [Jeotgalibacillus sp. S-D1]